MSISARISDVLQAVFINADELALKNNFVKRQRKVTGSNFVKTLLFSYMQKQPPSIEGLVRSGVVHNLNISAQGITKRFTKESSEFLKSVLYNAISYKIYAEEPACIEIFNRFSSVHIGDTSIVALPDELKTHWEGTGGNESTSGAAIKLDVDLELKTGELRLHLLQGKHSDNRSINIENIYGKGALRLDDLGFFKLSRMKAQSERGEYWISRYLYGTNLFDTDNQYIDFHKILSAMCEFTKFELSVLIGKEERICARLIACRVSQEVADIRRKKLKRNAQKHGRMATKENLSLCDWVLYLTNIEKDKLSIDECFVLYRVRWQIELLFKLWKTHNHINNSKGKNPYGILSKLYIKLLVVLVEHWILLSGLWSNPNRSLVKATQLIKEQSARLAKAVNNKYELLLFLDELSTYFSHGCSLNKRKKYPNTAQLLQQLSKPPASHTPSGE